MYFILSIVFSIKTHSNIIKIYSVFKVADKQSEDDTSLSVKNDLDINVKNDPEDVEIKDELLELPLDVTLEAEADSHIEPKSNSTDDEGDADNEQSE